MTLTIIWKIWKSDALWHSDFILYRYCLHLFHSNTDLAGIVFSDWGSSVLSLAYMDYEKIFGKGEISAQKSYDPYLIFALIRSDSKKVNENFYDEYYKKLLIASDKYIELNK